MIEQDKLSLKDRRRSERTLPETLKRRSTEAEEAGTAKTSSAQATKTGLVSSLLRNHIWGFASGSLTRTSKARSSSSLSPASSCCCWLSPVDKLGPSRMLPLVRDWNSEITLIHSCRMSLDPKSSSHGNSDEKSDLSPEKQLKKTENEATVTELRFIFRKIEKKSE